MARWVLALGGLLLGVTVQAGAAEAGAPDGSIEDYVTGQLPASGVPGLAYAVVADGGLTAVGARGVVRLGGDATVTPDTPFLTGSISKSFTALAVMQLVEAGAVDLDADAARYLDPLAGRPAGDMTIRQLLSHTAGFSTLQGNESQADSTGGDDELERRVDELAVVTPAYEPGERWEYSNANYQLLGRLIEVLADQDYQTYVATHILDPLGMRDSFVADGRRHESLATGHRPWFGTKQPMVDATTHRSTAPQGGIVASARDLALYLRMMMNGRSDVLSADGKALMMRPAGATSPFYGLGWFVDPDSGTVWHDGSSPGFESLATMRPADMDAVVVLVNGGSGIGFGETAQLRNGITAIALGLDYDGEGPRWSQKALFIGLVLLPVAYLGSAVVAWRRRARLRAKSGPLGVLSRWLPLVTTIAAAWVIVHVVPTQVGSPLRTIALFQPDLGVVLVASAVMGVMWAVLRLALAYTRRTSMRAGDGIRRVTCGDTPPDSRRAH